MVYYNEFAPYPADWLRRLIAAGELPDGVVDERSILEVQADDTADTSHFFAGIGGWPLALQMAGWPVTVPVWTGSCPCQPFSVAGRKAGASDPRHLWPEFRRLIAERNPPTIFGEQIAGPLGRTWVEGVRADVESLGYAFACAVLPAACVGTPHARERVFWVADAVRPGQKKSARRAARLSEAKEQPRVGRHFDLARGVLEGGARDLRVGHGLPGGVGRSRVEGYGNAIVPQVAAAFVGAFLDVRCGRICGNKLSDGAKR